MFYFINEHKFLKQKLYTISNYKCHSVHKQIQYHAKWSTQHVTQTVWVMILTLDGSSET